MLWDNLYYNQHSIFTFSLEGFPLPAFPRSHPRLHTAAHSWSCNDCFPALSIPLFLLQLIITFEKSRYWLLIARQRSFSERYFLSQPVFLLSLLAKWHQISLHHYLDRGSARDFACLFYFAWRYQRSGISTSAADSSASATGCKPFWWTCILPAK